MELKNRILKALGNVIDPDLGKDIVSLNFIEKLEVKGKNISFTIVLTTPACPLKSVFVAECKKYISRDLGSDYEVEINFDSRVAKNLKNNKEQLSTVKNLIVVASGKGGVGKSSIAINLAISLSKFGAKVGLLDADISGPSVPVIMGIDSISPEVKKIGKRNVMLPVKKYGVKVNSLGMLIPQGQPVVWRGPLLSSGLKQLLLDTEWGELDYLLIDLPPGSGDIHITLIQDMPVSAAIIVTTPEKISLADTTRTIEMFNMDSLKIPILGIVENMSYFSPEELPNNKYFIFGKGGGKELSESYGLPLLGELPLVMGVAEEASKGNPVSIKEGSILYDNFMDLAQKVGQQMAIINAR